MIKIKIKDLPGQRQIIRKSEGGSYRYAVKYINYKEISFYFIWSDIPFFMHTFKKERDSFIAFGNQWQAESYAKITYGDKRHPDVSYKIIMNIIGGDQFKKYGYFIFDNISYNSSDAIFKFNDSFSDTLGYSLPLYNFFMYPDESFKKLKNHIDKYDSSNEIVSSFDVVTLKAVPYEKIKASSDEMEELKKLISQYKEDMDKYQEFLTKLLSR